MVTEERSTEPWGPRPGEDWKAHRMRVFAEFPLLVALLGVAESVDHMAEIYRAWDLRRHEGDPEKQELIRQTRYSIQESPPEEDAHDFRSLRNRFGSDAFVPSHEFLVWLDENYSRPSSNRSNGA